MRKEEERRGRISGQVLWLIRNKLDVRQADLAADLGISIDTVRAREGGRRPTTQRDGRRLNET